MRWLMGRKKRGDERGQEETGEGEDGARGRDGESQEERALERKRVLITRVSFLVSSHF